VAIVHGDPGPGNFLHDGSAVIALTDWEFAHLGDPMEDWVYLVSMRGARTMPADRWRALIADVAGVEVTDWHMRYWGAFNFFKGACANLTCLNVFAGPNPAPNMAIIGSALQQTFMREMAALVAG
jgi:aminoglycoside phosphotransferase (APT) family kinase protein